MTEYRLPTHGLCIRTPGYTMIWGPVFWVNACGWHYVENVPNIHVPQSAILPIEPTEVIQ